MSETDLARRSITSVVYNSAANISRIVILFIRSILLARLLPIETFGIYSGAFALVTLTATAAAFGMGGAFVHRAPETEDTERAAAVHFTLILILTSLWAAGRLIFEYFGREEAGSFRTAIPGFFPGLVWVCVWVCW